MEKCISMTIISSINYICIYHIIYIQYCNRKIYASSINLKISKAKKVMEFCSTHTESPLSLKVLHQRTKWQLLDTTTSFATRHGIDVMFPTLLKNPRPGTGFFIALFGWEGSFTTPSIFGFFSWLVSLVLVSCLVGLQTICPRDPITETENGNGT